MLDQEMLKKTTEELKLRRGLKDSDSGLQLEPLFSLNSEED